MTHWIIVPVVLPAFVGAFIVLLIRYDLLLQRVFSVGASIALLATALALTHAATDGPQVYRLGDWPAPFGIVLVLDRLSALMVLLSAALGLIIQLYVISTDWDTRGAHFHALWQFQLMGLCGAFLTGDAFNLFVFFEVLLIASYGLMIHATGSRRIKAGVQYITFNLVGSTLFLIALATLYAVTGTLNMADLAIKVATLPAADAALLRVAGTLLLLVFAIKGALVPLHFWLPQTYANAPGPVAALFAVMTKVGAYGALRFYTLIFPLTTPATGHFFADLLFYAALVTLVVGAIGVFGARNLGRMVAFVAIASMGTVFIAVAQFTPQSAAAALYYIVHSTLAGAALFLIADLVSDRRAGDGLTDALPPIAQQGLIASLYFAAAIAAAGMPPLSGFIGKLLILDATRGGSQTLIWATILLSSLVMIVGMARAGSLLFWKSHSTDLPADAHKPEPLSFITTGALLAGLVGMTILAGPVMDYMQATAAELYDPAAYIAAHHLGAE